MSKSVSGMCRGAGLTSLAILPLFLPPTAAGPSPMMQPGMPGMMPGAAGLPVSPNAPNAQVKTEQAPEQVGLKPSADQFIKTLQYRSDIPDTEKSALMQEYDKQQKLQASLPAINQHMNDLSEHATVSGWIGDKGTQALHGINGLVAAASAAGGAVYGAMKFLGGEKAAEAVAKTGVKVPTEIMKKFAPRIVTDIETKLYEEGIKVGEKTIAKMAANPIMATALIIGAAAVGKRYLDNDDIVAYNAAKQQLAASIKPALKGIPGMEGAAAVDEFIEPFVPTRFDSAEAVEIKRKALIESLKNKTQSTFLKMRGQSTY